MARWACPGLLACARMPLCFPTREQVPNQRGHRSKTHGNRGPAKWLSKCFPLRGCLCYRCNQRAREKLLHCKTSSRPHLAQAQMILVSMAWEALHETRWLSCLREGITLERAWRLKVLLKKNQVSLEQGRRCWSLSIAFPLAWTRTQYHYLNTKPNLSGWPWSGVLFLGLLSK